MTRAAAAQEVRVDLRPRLEAAAVAVADAEHHTKLSREMRDRLVVEACDEGLTHGVVARAAGVSRTRVLAILVDSQPDQLLP